MLVRNRSTQEDQDHVLFYEGISTAPLQTKTLSLLSLPQNMYCMSWQNMAWKLNYKLMSDMFLCLPESSLFIEAKVLQLFVIFHMCSYIKNGRIISSQFHSGILGNRCTSSECPPWCLSKTIKLIEHHFAVLRRCWALTALNESCALHPCQISWPRLLSSLSMHNDNLEGKKKPRCVQLCTKSICQTAKIVYACVCCEVCKR